jgi:stage V sporulation protein SpoVS
MELEQQLGGLFSLLTVEFLVPYLNRKLNVAQKTGEIPRLPKGGIVKPTIVAGINALGRGQDRESLGQFLQVIAQTMGPEAIQQFINSEEVVKRLAASSGIDVLNLVKSMDEIQAEQQQSMEQQQAMTAIQQEPQMAAIDQKREQAEMQSEIQQQQQPPQI